VRQTLDPDDWARVLVIMGASTRAAAFSALRAGLRPICLDQYADADLEAVAEVIRVDDYPDGLPAALSPFPPYPVMYTGALENHPELIEQIALRQPLLGNDAATLRAVRDPCRVREVLAAAKVPHLEVCSSDQAPPADGRWLLKPQRGSCGRGVIPWTPSASGHPTLLEPHFFQERASGTCYSAVFAARQSPLQVRYVGLTRQLVGLQELHAAAFSWCGSLGPALLDTKAEILIRRTGTVLAHRFGLRGLFGFDFILDEDDQPLLTEVNPRYTGSVEVLEQLCELNLLVDHWVGCGRDLPEGLNPPAGRDESGTSRRQGGALQRPGLRGPSRGCVVRDDALAAVSRICRHPPGRVDHSPRRAGLLGAGDGHGLHAVSAIPVAERGGWRAAPDGRLPPRLPGDLRRSLSPAPGLSEVWLRHSTHLQQAEVRGLQPVWLWRSDACRRKIDWRPEPR
jgi:predicted ATP-grasp superfamily ATP-dependent carboligase